MKPLIPAIYATSFRAIGFLLAAFMLLAMPAAGQHGLSLSSQSDFSSKDRQFVDGETIYIKVEPRMSFDTATLTESGFDLTPSRGGEAYEGRLELQDDGSFTGSLEVSALAGNSTAWHLRVHIRDERENEYEARTAVVIHGRAGQRHIIRVSGTVDAASATEISVAGHQIAINSNTKLHARNEIRLEDLVGHEVVVSVLQQGDVLTALQIFVRGERDGTVDIVGRIEAVGEASIQVRDVEFAVNDATVITSGTGAPLTLSDLEPRMWVRIEAQRTEDGWVATAITARTGVEDDGEIEGVIEVIGEDFIEVAGMHFAITGRTSFKGVRGLEGLEVGMDVEVEFVTTDAGEHIAVEIEVENEDEEDGERRLALKAEGPITALGDRSITVQDIEFLVTEDTKIEGGGRGQLEFSDLAIGMHAEVKGVVRDGSPIAHKIEVKRDREDHVLIRGEITALGDRTVTVGRTEFHVNEETEIHGEGGADLSFEDLAVGQHAVAHLAKGDDGSLIALRIKVKRPFERDDVEITGKIQAVSASEITIREHTFAITERTEIIGAHGSEIAAEDLSVGMVAKVEGKITDGGALVASEIKVRTRLHHEGRFAGLVTAVRDDMLVVNDVEFNVTLDTIFNGVDALEDILIGTRVKLWYRSLADGSRLALRVQVSTDATIDAEVRGAIESIDGDAIVVAGVDVTTTAATSITDEEGDAATFADLEVGQTVEVEGLASGDGILATKIKIEDEIVVAGAIRDQTENTLQLAGVTFTIEGHTLIIGRSNALLTLDDLETGAYVEIIATGGAAAGKNGSGLVAERVLVLDGAALSTSSGDSGVPVSFRLEQNYPNPFNPATNITFDLDASAAGHVSLTVYNALGQEVATLVEGVLSEGSYTFQWNGRHDAGQAAASGIYLYRLRTGNQTATRSMILTK